MTPKQPASSVCIACGAYEHRQCEWDGDDPPCDHEDTFERFEAEPEIDPDYLRELRDERKALEDKSNDR